MIQTIEVKDVRLGEGIPKLIVPIVGETKDEILQQLRRMHGETFDIVEWRADCFRNLSFRESMLDVLTAIRRQLRNIPIIFTFRTSQEGGEQAITKEDYVELLTEVSKTGLVDIIDVEIFSIGERFQTLMNSLHAQGVFVLASNHDFEKTPSKEEIIHRLCRMQDLQADILKIAVTPESAKDVLTLLDATEEMTRVYAKKPVITMSMGKLGMISRIGGETFGVAATFGSAGKSSAPGQIEAGQLSGMLSVLHDVNRDD